MLKTTEFILICFGTGVVVFLLAAFVLGQGIALGIVEGAAAIALPYFYLNIRVWLRLKKADEQFADVLDALVNCFKTGYGFSRAIQVIAENYDDPWGTEFNKMGMEMNLGAVQEDCLSNLSSRIPTADVDLFVTALIIQKETGGNMAELLGNLSKTCRERYKLYRKVGAISAQGKLSAFIVICIPFGLMTMMYLFLPEAVVKFVTNPIGIVFMVLAGIWMCMGIGVLFKIVQIEV
jgi:tight adherence protein B